MVSPRPGDGEAQASPSARSPSAGAASAGAPSTGAPSGRPKARTRTDPRDLPLVERRRVAAEIAMAMLARRERSEAELRVGLGKKGFDADTAALVVEQLRSGGLVSDRRYAEAFATEAAQRRGYAAAVIHQRLRAKGVSAETASAAAAARPEDEEGRARDAAAKRARVLASLPPEVRHRRLVAFLARRGYPAELCATIAGEHAEVTQDDGLI